MSEWHTKSFSQNLLKPYLTRALEGGGGFCPPLMFFADIKQTNLLIFISFSVPDQK